MNKEIKILIEFGTIVKRLYDKSPRENLLKVLKDTYKLIEDYEVYKGRETEWDNIKI